MLKPLIVVGLILFSTLSNADIPEISAVVTESKGAAQLSSKQVKDLRIYFGVQNSQVQYSLNLAFTMNLKGLLLNRNIQPSQYSHFAESQRLNIRINLNAKITAALLRSPIYMSLSANQQTQIKNSFLDMAISTSTRDLDELSLKQKVPETRTYTETAVGVSEIAQNVTALLIIDIPKVPKATANWSELFPIEIRTEFTPRNKPEALAQSQSFLFYNEAPAIEGAAYVGSYSEHPDSVIKSDEWDEIDPSAIAVIQQNRKHDSYVSRDDRDKLVPNGGALRYRITPGREIVVDYYNKGETRSSGASVYYVRRYKRVTAFAGIERISEIQDHRTQFNYVAGLSIAVWRGDLGRFFNRDVKWQLTLSPQIFKKDISTSGASASDSSGGSIEGAVQGGIRARW